MCPSVCRGARWLPRTPVPVAGPTFAPLPFGAAKRRVAAGGGGWRVLPGPPWQRGRGRGRTSGVSSECGRREVAARPFLGRRVGCEPRRNRAVVIREALLSPQAAWKIRCIFREGLVCLPREAWALWGQGAAAHSFQMSEVSLCPRGASPPAAGSASVTSCGRRCHREIGGGLRRGLWGCTQSLLCREAAAEVNGAV